MHRWVVICWTLVAVVCADECPDGGRCEGGQTCCSDPASGFECCPYDQAECCEDHAHCCPGGTVCDAASSSCVNATAATPWAERTSAGQPRLSKSFRMIKTYMGEEDDNICPDQSRCPPEFSCLRALTRFGCCPLDQGVPCSDGKHCCPEGHKCSADSRSCIKRDLVTTVLCSDKVSECPDEFTCCDSPDGTWACCPMPQAVCCDDKLHCCPEGSTCDVEHRKCISSLTRKETPMWAKLPARMRAAWEEQRESVQVIAKAAVDVGSESGPRATTVNTVPPTQEEVSVLSVTTAAAGNDTPCSDTEACPDRTTCCKTKEGGWSCCPLPEAVCCEDFIHCCPKGKKCNLAAQTCDDATTFSVPWAEKVPTMPRRVTQGGVVCNATFSCEDGCTCCKTSTGGWACCPLPQAVCCDDHEHCCPAGTTCDLTTLTCQSTAGSAPMHRKTPAFVTAAPTANSTPQMEEEEGMTEEDEEDEDKEEEEEGEEEENKDVEGRIQCDTHTSCPQSTTCCLMTSSQKWGCCPLPDAVCCADGNHCCPTHYKCNEHMTSCVQREVVIPWYTKLPATSTSVQAHPNSVHCDSLKQCPQHTTCCRLNTGQWGCCPLQNAVCCQDKEHCCPQGYTCNMASNSCQKVTMMQLETVPLTPVYLPLSHYQPEPLKQTVVKCDDKASCKDGETCCRTSLSTWGCCPSPHAVCCSDMKHCCPASSSCTEAGECIQDTRLDWNHWPMFKKRSPGV